MQILSPVGSLAADIIGGVVIAVAIVSFVSLLRAYDSRRAYIYRLVKGVWTLVGLWQRRGKQSNSGLNNGPGLMLSAILAQVSETATSNDPGTAVLEYLGRVEAHLVEAAAYDDGTVVSSHVRLRPHVARRSLARKSREGYIVGAMTSIATLAGAGFTVAAGRIFGPTHRSSPRLTASQYSRLSFHRVRLRPSRSTRVVARTTCRFQSRHKPS